MSQKTLVFKNYFFLPVTIADPNGKKDFDITARSFQDWLNTQKLHGIKSRTRTRFLNIILERIEEIDKYRQELLQECSKNKKGEIVYLDEQGKETVNEKEGKEYKIKDFDKFNKEWGQYLNEDCIIDVTPANQEVINGVKSILLDTNEEFEGKEAFRYDEWCLALESVWNKTKK